MKQNNGDTIERTGRVTEILGSARFRVEIHKDPLLDNDPLAGKSVVCELRGKMYQRKIKIVRGDKVKLEITIIGSMDSMKTKIVFRLDEKNPSLS